MHSVCERSGKVERKKGQRYSNEFRREAVKPMRACHNIIRPPQELGINRRVNLAELITSA